MFKKEKKGKEEATMTKIMLVTIASTREESLSNSFGSPHFTTTVSLSSLNVQNFPITAYVHCTMVGPVSPRNLVSAVR
jgi:hypothetical protein